MRQIKFKRAYFLNEDKTGFLGFKMWGVNIDESTFTAPTNKSNSMSFIDYQFTGLLDKNRKEIYEGYSIKESCDYGNEYVVKWNEGHCSFRAYLDNDNDLSVSFVKLNDFEIIGNIYENPELLK